MSTNKDFKRLVRRRMHKTGESYTSARAQLLEMGSSKTQRTTADCARSGNAEAEATKPARAEPSPSRW